MRRPSPSFSSYAAYGMSCAALMGLLLLGAGCPRSPGPAPANKRGADKHLEHQAKGRPAARRVVQLSPEALTRAKVRAVAAELRDLPSEIDTTGEVAFDQDRVAHVSPRIPGRVHRVSAKLGDTVKARQSLAVIDSIDLGRAKARYLQARAQLSLARQSLRREEKLLAERITSAKEVLDARATHQKAMAEYRAARQRLRLLGFRGVAKLQYDKQSSALLAVRAPIAGRVIAKHVTLGELVRPSSNLFTVADLSRVWVWIDVYVRDLAHVHLDDTVQVRVEAYPHRVYTGKVGYLSDEVNRRTRAIRARLDVENSDRTLKPGMFARVRLSDPHAKDGKGKRRRVLAVPASALQRRGKGQVVFVELGERRFERRSVDVGVETAGYVQIRRGLKRGERVVVEGAFLVASEASKDALGGGHSH